MVIDLLKFECLHFCSSLDAQLAAYANLPGNKWKKLDDDTYFIHNHEEHVKSRNIEEWLRFERNLGNGIKLNY